MEAILSCNSKISILLSPTISLLSFTPIMIFPPLVFEKATIVLAKVVLSGKISFNSRVLLSLFLFLQINSFFISYTIFFQKSLKLGHVILILLQDY